jgi:Fic family protein
MKTPHYIPGRDVNYSLIREINEKIKRINGHPEYSNTIKKKIINTLTEETNAHSFMIELNKPNKETIENNKTNLSEAWESAKRNYKGIFSHDFFIDLSGEIEPDLYSIRPHGLGYREGRVRVTGEDPIPPINPQRISEEMISLTDFLNNDQEEPLIRSIFGHLHLARIHPLDDGNGRMSRMVQNLILDHNNYAPIKIEIGERNFYQTLLRGALRDYEDRRSTKGYNNNHSINLFFNYLASIENITLDRLEDELKKKRQFAVYVGDNEKGNMFIAKNTLKSRLKEGININFKQKKKMIFINGDISLKEIEPTLNCLIKKGILCNIAFIH